MKEKWSEVQPEPNVWASQQETSKSEQKNTRASVQGCISQGSEKLTMMNVTE